MNTYYKLKIFLIVTVCAGVLSAQKELLQSGPMVGYSDMREVPLWVQTKEESNVKIVYWQEGTTEKHETVEVTTNKLSAFTAHLVADEVEPGRKYIYSLFINDKEIKFNYPLEFRTQPLWRWRNDAPDFNFAIGSCAYVNEEQYDRPGKPYGDGYEIFTTMDKMNPDFMVWMGDNVYLREPDWNTRTGILKRNTHTRSLPELQPFFASTHNYAIWDDHDFGPNNSDRSFFNKDLTLEAFKLFWVNPSYGVNGNPGVTTKFEWNDVDFFMLDDRYYRTPNDRKTGKRVMFGDEQIEWLIDNLVNSTAPFKIIVAGGQLLNPNGRWEEFVLFPEEREKLFKAIAEEKITGVLFFTGDIHSSEITKMERSGTYPFYEFTISPLTAGPAIFKEETNPWRIPGYKTNERNFAYCTVTGPKGKRMFNCTNYNTTGEKVWEFSINENELK